MSDRVVSKKIICEGMFFELSPEICNRDHIWKSSRQKESKHKGLDSENNILTKEKGNSNVQWRMQISSRHGLPPHSRDGTVF
jgi:hypothetical protein